MEIKCIELDTGNEYSLKRIEDITEAAVAEGGIFEGGLIIDSVTNTSQAATFTGTIKINRLGILSILLGRKVTNNWLKLHGGVMTRRYSR